MISTFYYSFFENFMSGLRMIGPKYVGLDNFVKLFTEGDLLKYTENTLIMWVMGFVPQILVSLLLAAWFTNTRLKFGCVTAGKSNWLIREAHPRLIGDRCLSGRDASDASLVEA